MILVIFFGMQLKVWSEIIVNKKLQPSAKIIVQSKEKISRFVPPMMPICHRQIEWQTVARTRGCWKFDKRMSDKHTQHTHAQVENEIKRMSNYLRHLFSFFLHHVFFFFILFFIARAYFFYSKCENARYLIRRFPQFRCAVAVSTTTVTPTSLIRNELNSKIGINGRRRQISSCGNDFVIVFITFGFFFFGSSLLAAFFLRLVQFKKKYLH